MVDYEQKGLKFMLYEVLFFPFSRYTSGGFVSRFVTL